MTLTEHVPADCDGPAGRWTNEHHKTPPESLQPHQHDVPSCRSYIRFTQCVATSENLWTEQFSTVHCADTFHDNITIQIRLRIDSLD